MVATAAAAATLVLLVEVSASLIVRWWCVAQDKARASESCWPSDSTQGKCTEQQVAEWMVSEGECNTRAANQLS